MANNIEFKALATDFASQQALAEKLSDQALQILYQRDVFFKIYDGRLKLRIFGPGDGELIFYRRPDALGPKLSDYQISHPDEPDKLEALMSRALGRLATVNKRRTVYLCGRARLHFDQVDELGEFIEVEVVLTEAETREQSFAAAEQEARELMQALRIREDDLVECAYVDLLLQEQATI